MSERAQGGPVPPGWLNGTGMPEGDEVFIRFDPSVDVEAILSGLRAELVRRGRKEPKGGWLARWLA